MTTTGPDLAGAISSRREELGLSQAEAARRANVARPTWARWESGAARPYDSNYGAIERALEWERGSIRAILAGAQPTPSPPAHDNDAAPPGIDAREWASFDPIDREMIIGAIKIARRRIAKNHSDEGRRATP